MTPIAPDILEKAIQILGEEGITKEALEQGIASLVPDAVSARRLIDLTPELFGMVLVSTLGKPTFQEIFSTRDATGRIHDIPFKEEPLVPLAFQKAQHLAVQGPRDLLSRIASRSSLVKAADDLRSSGSSLDDLVFTPPLLMGIPAETYGRRAKSLWRRLFS